MADRVEEPFLWCCKCAGLRGEGRRQNPDCDHCASIEESSCSSCVRCNKYLEPTRFSNGDIVYWGVLDVCSRTQRGREGRSPRDMMSLLQGRDDSARAAWLVSASSLILGSSILKAMHRQTIHHVPQPVESQARPAPASSRGRREVPRTQLEGLNSRSRAAQHLPSPPNLRPHLRRESLGSQRHRQPSPEGHGDNPVNERDGSIDSQSLAYAASVRSLDNSPPASERSYSPHERRPRRDPNAAPQPQPLFQARSPLAPLAREPTDTGPFMIRLGFHTRRRSPDFGPRYRLPPWIRFGV